MASNFLTAVFLPLALFLIMLGMGLTLTLDDFKRVFVYPKAVLVGLVAQLVMLPMVGFAIASVFPLRPELAVGVMILSACPSGPTSNLLTFLSGGEVALSITLTAISSLITIFTIPLIVNGAMQAFMGEGSTLQLPLLSTIGQIAVITILPVVSGMVVQRYAPVLANKADKWVKWFSLFFLAVVIAGVLLKERNNFIAFVMEVGAVTLILNLVTMALGFAIATVARLNQRSAIAITVEVGIQNGTLAIAVASAPTLLNQPTMAVPAAIYSLLMFATGAGFAWWANQTQAWGREAKE